MTALKTTSIAIVLATTLLAVQVFSSPVPGDSVSISNINETSKTSQSSVPGDVGQNTKKEKLDESMVKQCTLKALRVTLSHEEMRSKLSQKCRELLSSLIQGTSEKRKTTAQPEDINLRRELNALAENNNKYETLSQQIQDAENLLAERRVPEIEDTGFSKPDTSREMEPKNNEMVDFNSNNFRSNPLLDRNRNLRPSYDYRQRSFNTAREMLDRDRQVDIWSREFANEPGLDQPALLTDGGDNLDDDFLVIPIRFLRKNLMLDEIPVNTEFAGNSKKNSPTPKSTSTDWNGEKNEMVNWLLRALLSSEGNGVPAKEDSYQSDPLKAVATASNTGNQHKRDDVQNAGASDSKTYDSNDEKREGKRIMELDEKILSRVANDMKNLRKDLFQLQLGNTV